jgi:hypothetical protein
MRALTAYEEVTAAVPAVLNAQATTDAQLIRLWPHGRNLNTHRAYRRKVEPAFLRGRFRLPLRRREHHPPLS